MSATAAGLKDLHQIHIQLDSVRQKMTRGPRRVSARRRAVDKKQTEIGELKEQLKQLKMAADEKSLQLKTNEGKLVDLNAKLNAVTSNREFDIFKSQIEADKMANSVLEDEILEAFEKVDQTQTQVQEAENDYSIACKEAQTVSDEVAAAEPGLQSELAEIESALKAAEVELPGSILETYRRLVQAHGHEAITSVTANACDACHAILAPQMLVEINTHKFVFCRSCGRLLYRHETE